MAMTACGAAAGWAITTLAMRLIPIGGVESFVSDRVRLSVTRDVVDSLTLCCATAHVASPLTG